MHFRFGFSNIDVSERESHMTKPLNAADGLRGKKELAGILGISSSKLWYYLADGRVRRPTSPREGSSKLWYTESEFLAAVADFWQLSKGAK